MKRHYFHGDAHEERPGSYYCEECDVFAPAAHFTSAACTCKNHHLRAELSARRWQRTTGTHRPASAENLFAVAPSRQARYNAWHPWRRPL